jgi:hypothetical protein
MWARSEWFSDAQDMRFTLKPCKAISSMGCFDLCSSHDRLRCCAPATESMTAYYFLGVAHSVAITVIDATRMWRTIVFCVFCTLIHRL